MNRAAKVIAMTTVVAASCGYGVQAAQRANADVIADFQRQVSREPDTLYTLRFFFTDAGGEATNRPLTSPHLTDRGMLGYSVINTDEPTKPATTEPAKPADAPKPVDTTKPKPKAAPSLDELLGLTPPTPAPDAAKPAADPTKPARPNDDAQLDRLLTAQEMGDAFKQAVTLMGDAAKRLDTAADPGLPTQRIQEDIIRKLDQLLSSLDRQQQQQQQQQQNQDPKNRPQNQQKSQQQQQQQQQQAASGNPDDQGDRPTLKTGALKPELESARAAWGALPARVRDMLLQGAGDRFSSRYKTLTEEYYKRLAEEASR